MHSFVTNAFAFAYRQIEFVHQSMDMFTKFQLVAWIF